MRARALLSATLLLPLVLGCATIRQASEERGPLVCAAVGGFVGGVAGAIIGNNNNSGDPGAGAAIGLGSGAAVGAALCAAFARPNLEPVVSVSGGPLNGTAPLTVNLRADASDADGEIVSYTWDLGDGNTTSGESLSSRVGGVDLVQLAVAHTYKSPGVYTAALVIQDDDGLMATNSVRINVTAPVSAPPPARRPLAILGDLYFAFDSAELLAEADGPLGSLVRELQGNPELRVRVSGYTDNSGPEEYNQALSERRTQSVASYLRTRGVAASRIDERGYGESSPVANNATREGRSQNRRVELEIQP